jgi:hypothetical protein
VFDLDSVHLDFFFYFSVDFLIAIFSRGKRYFILLVLVVFTYIDYF